MKFRGILFDLDGTLLNTLDDIADTMNSILRRSRYPVHPVDAYRFFVGEGAEMLVKRALPQKHSEQRHVQRCLNEFRKKYSTSWGRKTAPYEGVETMLDELLAENLYLAILSNKPHWDTQNVVRHFFGSRHFTACIGHGIFPRKPDAEAAVYIASVMGIAPSECLYIGDSGVDMETAGAAGMPATGVLWGYRNEDELLKYGARWLVHRPKEIRDIVLGDGKT